MVYNMHLIALLKFWIVCQIRRICLDKTAVILNMKQMWIQVKWTLNKRLTWDCITHLVIHAHLCSSKSKVFEKNFFYSYSECPLELAILDFSSIQEMKTLFIAFVIFFLIYPYRPMLKLCPAVAAILDFRLTQKTLIL